MTALASVTIDRSSLSLSDLVIDSEGFSTYYLDVSGLGRPAQTPRETLATASPFVSGQSRSSVVYEETTLVLQVRIQASSSAALDTAVIALEAALRQFTYSVTVVVDGVTKVYTAYPASWAATDGLVAVERVRAFHEDLALTIPIYPVAS